MISDAIQELIEAVAANKEQYLTRRVEYAMQWVESEFELAIKEAIRKDKEEAK